MPPLGPEAQGLIERVKKDLSDLKTAVGDLVRTHSSLADFQCLIDELSTGLNDSLLTQLTEVAAEGQPHEIFSLYIETLESSLQQLIYQLRSFLAVQTQVPAVLYQLNQWFFSAAYRSRTHSPETNTTTSTDADDPDRDSSPPYLITLGDTYQTSEFTQYLMAFELDSLSPLIWQALNQLQFYFIEVPYFDASEQRATVWIICLHEAGHVIDDFCGLTASKFPELPQGYYRLIRDARAGDLEAKKALWLSEYLADGLALAIAGPLFALSFARNHTAIHRILHPWLAHPSDLARIRYFIESLRKGDFLSAANEIEERLNELFPGWADQEIDPKDSELQTMSREILNSHLADIAWYKNESLCRDLAALGARDLKVVAADVKEAKPVVALPSFLFTLVALEIPNPAPEQNEFLADMMRLAMIANAFANRVMPLVEDKHKGEPLRPIK